MTSVLVVGGGAREHAVGWKLRQSPGLSDLLFAPGNGGTTEIGTNLPVDALDFEGIIQAAKGYRVGLVFVGPDEPLAKGLTDELQRNGIACFGPSRQAARIEASKGYSKDLMDQTGVPTASWRSFTDPAAAQRFVESHALPVVVKADGLTAGKGVAVCETVAGAQEFIELLMNRRRFGDAGVSIVIEECLVGTEVSAFALCDGERAVMLAAACDYKAIGDGDTGPNTGGMGSYSPPEAAIGVDLVDIYDRTIAPVLGRMAANGNPFRGILYAGLMFTAQGPKVLEFNSRVGDPEAQVVLPRLDGDFLAWVKSVAEGGPADLEPLSWDDRPRVGVVMVSAGYPGDYTTGHPISGLDQIDADALVFHAGTKLQDGQLVTAGGRVLTVVGTGPSMAAARDAAYRNAARIRFEGAYCRTDIALRAVDATSTRNV